MSSLDPLESHYNLQALSETHGHTHVRHFDVKRIKTGRDKVQSEKARELCTTQETSESGENDQEKTRSDDVSRYYILCDSAENVEIHSHFSKKPKKVFESPLEIKSVFFTSIQPSGKQEYRPQEKYRRHCFWEPILAAVKSVTKLLLELSDDVFSQKLVEILLSEFGEEVTWFYHDSDFIKSKVILTIAVYLKEASLHVDRLIPKAQETAARGFSEFHKIIRLCREVVEKHFQRSPSKYSKERVMGELLYHFYTSLQAPENNHLAGIVTGMMLTYSTQELLESLEDPPILLAKLVEKLLELQTRVAQVAMEFLPLDLNSVLNKEGREFVKQKLALEYTVSMEQTVYDRYGNAFSSLKPVPTYMHPSLPGDLLQRFAPKFSHQSMDQEARERTIQRVQKHIMGQCQAKAHLVAFFQYFSLNFHSGIIDKHVCPDDPGYQSSMFRIQLIDTNAALIKLLTSIDILLREHGISCNSAAYSRFEKLDLKEKRRLAEVSLRETMEKPRRSDFVIVVDFEGVKLNRVGEMCLLQVSVPSENHELVNVIDISSLGKRAFEISSGDGTSLRSILECPDVRKAWFDPRNDVDALFHQFNVYSTGVFDIQLAEVAYRKSRGLPVRWVTGLPRCLHSSKILLPHEASFASTIDELGKRLFEPEYGGSYEVFRQRPLNPIVMVYAAHDVRHMSALYDHYVRFLDSNWLRRVEVASCVRANWCMHEEYVCPTTECPEF